MVLKQKILSIMSLFSIIKAIFIFVFLIILSLSIRNWFSLYVLSFVNDYSFSLSYIYSTIAESFFYFSCGILLRALFNDNYYQMAVVYSIVEISWRIFSTTTVISEFDVLLYIFYYSIYLIIPIAAISGVFFLDLSIRIFKEMKTNKGKQSRE